jgi:hypothetical protein
MTPKEKAKELMQKFVLSHVLAISNTKGKLISPYVSNYAYSIVRKDRAKSCALIAVDELIEFTQYCSEFGGEILGDTKEYWEIVKQEIEKL